jgi:hypothetical protein
MLHPLALAALVVLVVNDWWAKAAHPSWLTGKLSDVAGLVVAPLALTAAVGLLGYGLVAVGCRLDPSLRRGQLGAAIALVGMGFLACKLDAGAAALLVRALRWLGGAPRIVVDPTDLAALPALWLAWRVGQAELRLVPRGRVHAALRGSATGFADVRAAGAAPDAVAELEAALRAAGAGGTALPAVNGALFRLATSP